ncbi:MAG: translation elongation factor Ts [Alphaproteobacteria bacterium GM202ARS2]|nr:translation elongation factor Ts [Alphaproteobacteria bacterium GM202ARS2]
MTSPSIEQIKALRDKTGAGMMDCKAALQESGGDRGKAEDWLRKKGIAKASQKSERATGEGIIAVALEPSQAGVMIEINTETDFVARNELLQEFARSCASLALRERCGDKEALLALPYGTGDSKKSVQVALTDLIASVGENLVLQRVVLLEAGEGTLVSYVHNAYQDNIGRIGVMLTLRGEGQSNGDLGKQLAMHVAAMAPLALSAEAVPKAWEQRERDIILAQEDLKDKPADIAEKMAEGRLRKRYQEVVLLDQLWVLDGKTRMRDVLAQHGAEIVSYVRFALGESTGDTDG